MTEIKISTVNDIERADAWMSANVDCVADARNYNPGEATWAWHWIRKRDDLAAQFAALRAPLEARIAELTSERDELTALEKTWHEELHRLCAHWVGRIAESVDPLKHRVRELERELKSVQEYAAVAHQNGLDTYQAERTALLERIAELETAAAISGQVIVAQADKITEMEAMSEPIEAINSGDLVLRVSAAHDGSRYTVSVYRGDPKDGRLVVQTGGHHERPATWDGAGMDHTWDGAGVNSIVFKLDGGLLLSLDRFSTSVRMSEPHPLAEADGP